METLQFNNVKELLYWYFYEMSKMERPKALRSAASTGEVIGKSRTVQDAAKAIATHQMITEKLRGMKNREIVALKKVYQKRMTKTQLMKLNMHDVFYEKYHFSRQLIDAESEIEMHFKSNKVISEAENFSLPVYVNEEPEFIEGLVRIGNKIGKSESWMRHIGVKRPSLQRILFKKDKKWCVRTEDIERWLKFTLIG